MYLGVDGGGTKTAYALVDSEGRLRASHVGKSVAYLADGLDAARERLKDGVAATLAGAGIAALPKHGGWLVRGLCGRRCGKAESPDQGGGKQECDS